MGFAQLPPQHSQFFQKLSSRMPDLRNPVLLGCHWYLTYASCVCIFMYFPRMTVWPFFFSFRFFLMTVFHERPPVISRVPRLSGVSVHLRPPLECDSIDSIWRFHMAPGQKLMMKLGIIRSNRARLGQLFWGFGTFWMWVSSNTITFLACGHIVSSYPAFQACDGVKRVNLAADLVTKSEKSWTKGFKITHVRISTVKASLVDLPVVPHKAVAEVSKIGNL